ncbi:MAG: methyltransferase domain-containing protein [Acidobacteria bacterium]|nr:methyltransferase domain-containing protein [Acidobacteriota bacterium]
MADFTGERIIPGKVHLELWNEHFARYAFAVPLAHGRRVLDLGCGTGYGAAELAKVAVSVLGIDISHEALDYARSHYINSNLFFQIGSAEQIPSPDGSFDLVVAFELIEHLPNCEKLLSEARRVLAPGGQLVVSTPNRLYYAESRRLAGANPFHVHEFDFAEFRAVLAEFFPHTDIFFQNHSAAIVFQPLERSPGTDVRCGSTLIEPEESHFFVAVCSLAPLTSSTTFVYVPATSNVLREREQHIHKLENELDSKTAWLEQALGEHQELVERFRAQTAELEQRNRWAEQLDRHLDEAGHRVIQLQDELAAEQKGAAETVAQYEAKIQELEADIRAKTQWALESEERLSGELAAKCDELANCVELLHQSEKTLEERTRWALDLQSQVDRLQAQVSYVIASRWFRLGRTLGLGPELTKS